VVGRWSLGGRLNWVLSDGRKIGPADIEKTNGQTVWLAKTRETVFDTYRLIDAGR